MTLLEKQRCERILEICVDSLESALVAQEAGADRIELCSCLEVGGLTPDPVLFSLVREKLAIPIHVLIRPRIGNFIYNKTEQTVILRSIEYFNQRGADAVVIGALNTDDELDLEIIPPLLEVASKLSVTFHRAYDLVRNPIKALKQLDELGVSRILTSGQKASAPDGIELFQQLLRQTTRETSLLAGGGINSRNVVNLLDIGITEVHASARIPAYKSLSSGKVALSQLQPDEYRVASFQEIVNLRTQLDNYQSNDQ